jgi:hypothetical protein
MGFDLDLGKPVIHKKILNFEEIYLQVYDFKIHPISSYKIICK